MLNPVDFSPLESLHAAPPLQVRCCCWPSARAEGETETEPFLGALDNPEGDKGAKTETQTEDKKYTSIEA